MKTAAAVASKRRILIVEDNADLAQLLALNLRDASYHVDVVHDGHSGLEAVDRDKYDLVILDVMLPGIDGLEVCRRLRHTHAYLQILMLTARSTELDRVLGLEIGADDYVTKPFSVLELLARVKAFFRRIDHLNQESPPVVAQEIRFSGLAIDLAKRQVTINGLAIELTAKEFELLVYFATHPGVVFSRSQLLDSVWGYGHAGYEHTVNSHINRLRAKIEQDPNQPQWIITVWGVGYKFADRDNNA